MSGKKTPAARSRTSNARDPTAARLNRQSHFVFPKSPPVGGLFFSANFAQDRKSFEQPHAHLVDASGQEWDPGQNQQRPHGLLDAMKIIAEARQKGCERFDRKGRDHEWNSKAERIDREQACPFRHGLLGRRDCQNRREDWSNARRPSKGESEPDHIGAPESNRLGNIDTFLPLQKRDRGHTKEMQPHNDNGNAGDDCERPRIGANEGANNARTRAERNEHGGKAEYEESRGSDGFALDPRLRLLVRKSFERRA